MIENVHDPSEYIGGGGLAYTATANLAVSLQVLFRFFYTEIESFSMTMWSTTGHRCSAVAAAAAVATVLNVHINYWAGCRFANSVSLVLKCHWTVSRSFIFFFFSNSIHSAMIISFLRCRSFYARNVNKNWYRKHKYYTFARIETSEIPVNCHM